MTFLPRNMGIHIVCVWIIVMAGLLAKAAVMGGLGQIGPDSDDVMRLIQIRDFLAGQSWFDPSQSRMGAGGTDMHWSRLADLPVIALIHLFDTVLPAGLAEKIAITVWPPLSAGLVIWGVLVGARHLSSQENQTLAQRFAIILLLFLLIPHFRFAPGAIDHHNLQLGLMAVSVGYACDPALRARSFAISAIALALSIAIGVEVNAFVAIVCGLVAINWWLKGQAAKNTAIAFGAAFALTLGVAFLVTIAPQNYGIVACDALSLITVLAGGAGGIGLAVAALITSRRNAMWRMAALLGIGFVCAGILALKAPQCLANPLGSLPPEMTELWLGNIEEAQPLFADKTQWLSLAPFAIGTTLLACGLAIANMLRRERPVMHGGLALLLITVIALTLYQTRFYVFGPIIALPILAVWIARVYQSTRSKDANNPLYMLALAASLPAVWGFPGLMLTPAGAAAPQAAHSTMCYAYDVMTQIAALDKGLFAATPNGTAPLLSETHHRALSGNYHRNVDGIVSNIRIFTSPPQAARREIMQSGVDYIHVCIGAEDSLSLADYNPEGLMAQLIAGKAPDYLTLLWSGSGGSVSIYGVKPAEG